MSGDDAAPFSFQRFAAIDWSGARGRRHKGIALAECRPGRAAPQLIHPGRVWSRTDVLDWIRCTATGDEATLIAMDFSFAPPRHERGHYLPGTDAPAAARQFWAFVNSHCDDQDLGAASFLESSFREHFYLGAIDGTKADYMHFRRCEKLFNEHGGGKASTVYDAIGAGQVAKASFAGMRLLHHLDGAVAVWPFDFPAATSPPPGNGSVLVEMYARSFIRLAAGGGRGLKLRTTADLNKALAGFDTDPVANANYTDHETDVLISAAGLRHIAPSAAYWFPPQLTPEIAMTEGWTFGVR